MQQTLTQYQLPASKQSKVEQYIEEHKFFTNWVNVEHDGWRLPATQEPHYWCGIWKSEGCLNREGHEKLGKGRRVYLKQYQRSCYRGSCRTCYRKWIAREANKATRRIKAYEDLSKQKPISRFRKEKFNRAKVIQYAELFGNPKLISIIKTTLK